MFTVSSDYKSITKMFDKLREWNYVISNVSIDVHASAQKNSIIYIYIYIYIYYYYYYPGISVMVACAIYQVLVQISMDQPTFYSHYFILLDY